MNKIYILFILTKSFPLSKKTKQKNGEKNPQKIIMCMC